MKERIEGKNIYLRRMTMEDTAAAVKWRNAPCVREQFIFKDIVTEEMHREWFRTKVMSGKVEQFVIGLKQSGEEIGSQYYKDIDKENKTAEYGIYIGREDMLGKGYGSEVMELALEYARSDMGLKEITLRVLESNARARKVYEGRGFTEYAREGGELPVIFMKRIL